MSENTKNYLLGNGNFYTQRIIKPGSPSTKHHPYSFDAAKKRLSPMFDQTISDMKKLPNDACPENESVIKMMLHPAYISMSFFPRRLLQEFNLKAVGNHAVQISPEFITNKKQRSSMTAELYVAGNRQSIKDMASELQLLTDCTGNQICLDFRKFEKVATFSNEEKTSFVTKNYKNTHYEAVLHTAGEDYILDGFKTYAENIGLEIDLDLGIQMGGLFFLPLEAQYRHIQNLAKFSFLRCVRPLPKLQRPLPIGRSVKTKMFPVIIPSGKTLCPNLKVALFDGGVPKMPDLDQYVKRLKGDKELGKAATYGLEHGLGVTSAFLFGSLSHSDSVPVPFAPVRHFRVYDDKSSKDYLYYDVAKRIARIIQNSPYLEFLGLSVGPNINVQDDTIDLWTALLDRLLADGKRFTSVAIGNCGEDDPDLEMNRIQPPADCVNALAVGSCTTTENDWKKADYSAVGPGRCPGIVKPDGLIFGGTENNPFFVLSANRKYHTTPTAGTSFAAPLALRTAVGIKANLGASINPLTLKALMIHKADTSSFKKKNEIGWGKFSENIDDYILCKEGEATIIYQGTLMPRQWLRAQIPVPSKNELKNLGGNYVTIGATFCFACQTEPENPFNYTRAGLEIAFRPNQEKFTIDKKTGKKALHPKTDTFFSMGKLYEDENTLRSDAHKWETTLHKTTRKQCKSLNQPVFDIHYLAREDGQATTTAQAIPYSLVVTVKIPKMPELYDRIVQLYQELEILTPIEVEVPITK